MVSARPATEEAADLAALTSASWPLSWAESWKSGILAGNEDGGGGESSDEDRVDSSDGVVPGRQGSLGSAPREWMGLGVSVQDRGCKKNGGSSLITRTLSGK